MLSEEQAASFRRDGFLVLPDFVDAEAIASLRQRAVELVDAWEPTAERTVFTTEQERVSKREFLASGDRTWRYLEEDALGPNGGLTRPEELSINQLGHAMHDIDPVFERFTYTPELATAAADMPLRRLDSVAA